MGGAYLDEVDLSEGLVVSRLLDVENGNDVLVVEVPKQLHLTQRPQTEHGVVEGRDLLDGDLLARGLVQRRAVEGSAKLELGHDGGRTYATTPYAPSPTTSWISYCSDTLKEIFLELPLPAGARDMVIGVGVEWCAGARRGGARGGRLCRGRVGSRQRARSEGGGEVEQSSLGRGREDEEGQRARQQSAGIVC